MATYGYSTPYTGMRQPVLPPGYMEAATAPGRNLAAGIAQLGAGIGQAIQRYQTSKAENEAATQTFETLSGMAQQALASDPSYQALQNYYETGQLPQGVTEADLQRFSKKAEADRSMLNRMVGLGEKFGDMSVAKKKAAIGDMAMVLQQYQQRGEQEMKRELGQIELDKARREAATRGQIDELTKQAMGLPTTRTVDLQEAYQVPVPPPVGQVPATTKAQAPQPTIEEVAKQKLALKQEADSLENLAVLNEREAITRENQLKEQQAALNPTQAPYSRTALGASMAGSGTGIRIPAPQGQTRTPTPLEQEVAQEQFRRQSEEVTALTSQLRQKASEDRAKAQQLRAQIETVGKPAAVGQQAKAAAVAPAFETRTRTVQSQQQVPYEDLRRQLVDFARTKGMAPEAFASIDKVLEMAGTKRPIQVESSVTPEGITVIRADGKVDIIPPVKQPNQPLTEADKSFMSNVSEYRTSLVELNNAIDKYGTSEFLDPKGSVLLDSIPYKVAIMYAKIVDPSSVAREGEVAAAKKYLIPLGVGVRPSVAKAAIENQLAEIERRTSVYEQMTGRRVPGSSGVAESSPSSGRYTLTRGKEIKPVQ